MTEKDRRLIKRRKCNYYIKVMDFNTEKVIGYFSDFSPTGFKIDSYEPIPLNRDFNLRVDIGDEISTHEFISFVARSRWWKPDPTDPAMVNEGFQIVGISQQDNEIFQKVISQYGTDTIW